MTRSSYRSSAAESLAIVLTIEGATGMDAGTMAPPPAGTAGLRNFCGSADGRIQVGSPSGWKKLLPSGAGIPIICPGLFIKGSAELLEPCKLFAEALRRAASAPLQRTISATNATVHQNLAMLLILFVYPSIQGLFLSLGC